jgi:crotonobetainyl-CoA:carnitine CoA-transferase CaiB-like acyl-CoA transferase
MSLGFEPGRLLERVTVTGASEPFMPCVLRVTDAMTAMHICVASLSNLYAEQRKGQLQSVSVNSETATMQMFACMSWEWSGRKFFSQYQGGDPAKPLVWREGTPAILGFPEPDQLARFGKIYWNLFECADKRYVFLTPFINPYPPEKLLELTGMSRANVPRFLSLLQRDDDFPEALQMMKDAVKNVPSAIELEKIMFKEKAGGCWAVKSMDEFLEADQGDWCRSRDQIHIDKVDGWAPAGFGDQPLDPGDGIYKGLKVVEMTRIVMVGSYRGAPSSSLTHLFLVKGPRY